MGAKRTLKRTMNPFAESFSEVQVALGTLDRKSRRTCLVLVLAQALTAVLDVLGVLAIGLVTVHVAESATDSATFPGWLSNALDAGPLSELDSAQETLLVGVAAAAFFLGKGFVSLILLRRQFQFLAHRQSVLGETLMRRLMFGPFRTAMQIPSQQAAYGISAGTTLLIVGVLGSLAVVLSEGFLLLILSIALIVYDPVVSVALILLFAGTGVALHSRLARSAEASGQAFARSQLRAHWTIQESVSAYRELYVANHRQHQVVAVQLLTSKVGDSQARLTFLNQTPRYVYENLLRIGGLAFAGFQIATQASTTALASLAIFLAAGSRIMPSTLRLQNGIVSLRSAAAASESVLQLIETLAQDEEAAAAPPDVAIEFVPRVKLEDVSFAYDPNSTIQSPAISHFSLEIATGERLAIVGSTGSGKSTLVDVILGLLQPQSGQVLVSGVSAAEAAKNLPGLIAYVPQKVELIEGTLLKNVAWGLSPASVDAADVERVLGRAHLRSLWESPQGLETLVSQESHGLSGGQRQRVGLAWALLTEPRLLVLDETTGALDSEAEAAISETLESLRGHVTLIVIAHRLASIRTSDRVAYLEDRTLLGLGTFDELREQVPRFEHQARLLGL